MFFFSLSLIFAVCITIEMPQENGHYLYCLTLFLQIYRDKYYENTTGGIRGKGKRENCTKKGVNIIKIVVVY